MLRLSGPAGNLDIFSVYFPTGNQATSHDDEPRSSLFQQRCQLRQQISEHLQPHYSALSLIGGDFNYVVEKTDRWTVANADWSHHDDEPDEKHFQLWLGREHGLCELHQPHATHASALARSRLDRVYSSHSLSKQLDSSMGCAALDWNNSLSNHRPVIFFRHRCSKRPSSHPGPLPSDIIKKLCWPRKVALDFHEKLSQEMMPISGLVPSIPIRSLNSAASS